ncbi:MAG: hypothetical protein L0Z53_23280 [Acidobacteriales bacterium]|nr:hypothetical protein [Terriglobales bacterium]
MALLGLYPGGITAQAVPAAVDYRLTARINPQVPQLEVAGTLRFPAAVEGSRELAMVLTENAKSVKLELNDGKGGAIALWAEKQSGDDPPERRKWLIRLPAKSDGKHPLLKFSYVLEKQTTPIFHIGADGAFAGGISTAWYPQLVGADGTRMLALGEISFEVPRGHVVFLAGTPIQSSKDKTAGSLRFRLVQPAYISFASGPYKVQNQGKFSLYLLRERKNSLSYLHQLERVIKVLTAEFGPFPYQNFALIEVQADAGRAAGFDGASLDGMMLAIGPFLDRPFNVAFYGHEIGHQWWGGVVRRKGTDGAYLMDEALAQWGSLRAVEAIAGKKTAEQYRRVGYPGYYFEYSGLSYLRRSREGYDHQLAPLPIADGTLSRRVANSKGMLVWDMLAATVGRDRFRPALKESVRQNWFRRVTWKELWNSLASNLGQGDLSWFYAQWLERKGAPSWNLSWRQEGRTLHGLVEQEAPFYRLEVKILITGEECSNKQVRTLSVQGPRTEFAWELPFQATSVTADPEFEILHWTDEYRKEAAALEPYTRGDLKLLYGKNEEARALFVEALKSAPESEHHGLRFLLEFGLGQALLDLGELKQSQEHLLRALSLPVKRPEVVPEVYAALADLAVRQGDRSGLESALRGARLAEQEALQATVDTNCGGREKH